MMRFLALSAAGLIARGGVVNLYRGAGKEYQCCSCDGCFEYAGLDALGFMGSKQERQHGN